MPKIQDIYISTSDISVNQVCKNYKELCAALYIDPEYHKVTGTQRQAVLKEIERYIKYSKSGHSFIIQEIYDQPLDKDDKRLQGRYVKYVEVLLCKYLTTHVSPNDGDNTSCNLTPLNWFKIFGFCNHKYKDVRYYNDLLQLEHLDKDAIYDFYFTEDDRLKKILISSLNSLRSRRLIDYGSGYVLCTERGVRSATQEEIDSIRNAERDTLEEMHINSLFQIRLRKISNKFFPKVVEKLRDSSDFSINDFNSEQNKKYNGDFFDLLYYFRAIEIRFSYSRVKEQLNLLIGNNEEKNKIIEALQHTNDNTVNSIHESIQKKKDKIVIGHCAAFDRYEQQQEALINKLIKFEKEDIDNNCKIYFNSNKK